MLEEDLCPVLSTLVKLWKGYSEIRGLPKIYSQIKFWHFINIF